MRDGFQRIGTEIATDWREMGVVGFILGVVISLAITYLMMGFLTIIWMGGMVVGSLVMVWSVHLQDVPVWEVSVFQWMVLVWMLLWLFVPPITMLWLVVHHPERYRWPVKPVVMRLMRRGVHG